jgi:hypothetical protein
VKRTPLLGLLALPALAQAPLLQDGAAALRQARLDWALGQTPLGPSSMPSFEVGWGGAGAEGSPAPLTGGEGLGRGTRGWGLGLQGRYGQGGWSFSATVLALRDEGHTRGLLQRAALAYETESGWRAALEQAPLAWGAGLNGGELLGASARPLPRISLATPEASLPLGRWRLEAFAGKLERDRPIPDGLPDREARLAAQAAGLDLQAPRLWGGFLRAAFGTHLDASLGAVTLDGGTQAGGQPAPSSARRTRTLAEVRVRVPALAQLFQAQGAALTFSRSGLPGGDATALSPGRSLGNLQLVWEGWDLAFEYAGAAPYGSFTPLGPAYLAGFSTYGDPLGPSFDPTALTRTLDLGLPLFLEGQGHFKLIRLTAPSGADPAWLLQAEGQWRTPTGRIGATLASRRDPMATGSPRWGWAFSVFQAFRVF